jgi:cytochrome c-type biogenesis protein CcmH
MRRLAALLALLVLAAPAAAAETPTLADLEDEVICPTCQTTLELSNSPVATQMRGFIRERIAAGDTKDEIKAELVDEFGEGVLAAPPKSGFNLIAWALPLAGLLAALVAVTLLARRYVRVRPEPAAAGPAPPLDPELERRVDEELARFDS